MRRPLIIWRVVSIAATKENIMKKQQVETGPAVGEIWKNQELKGLRAHVRRIEGNTVHYVPFWDGFLGVGDLYTIDDTLQSFMARYKRIRR